MLPVSLAQVVRGSILIKNTMDTTGGARVIDVVETETDGEAEPLLDDNTNLFHNTYHQGKENPMYSSDEDLSKLARKPAFTQIFDDTDAVQIPVNRGAYTARVSARLVTVHAAVALWLNISVSILHDHNF